MGIYYVMIFTSNVISTKNLKRMYIIFGNQLLRIIYVATPKQTVIDLLGSLS